ncbi:MAG: BlaI/MecI/CopY family transcriptional regulator [Theionarchaea archaeon]|nr:BlaI/MecI/CopY family transcriptional regulator [Theionarchaea archaeon]MBU7000192.1 BlaI/MecI/CopY family transcriptional regulator [Theionarchaea archaeon]MBU7020909.1 BlaI/MecI/CopY family transcriptional regulator [Theionarchaea archaeon]MBU7033961.1 BlaI/MecI/CopY family transcriptional regulator [Theionarchaea archaeon]MBU7040543.1 BlaI/MecI/CopY family transcriptional regulator [Theionarchaea archaeon]
MNDKIRGELVLDLVVMARYWGLSEGSSAIYAVLALSGKSLNMNELQKLTGYSLSSVSTHLRSLTEKYLVTKRKKEGVYVYTAEMDFEQIFRLLSKELLDRNILPLYRKVTELRESQEETLNQHLSRLEEEMSKLIDYLTKIIAMRGEAHGIKENQILVPGVS